MPPLRSSPSLRDIAERAQVSRMTVSLALRNSSTISTATRSRIQGIARMLGHRPDPVISDLMAKLSKRSKARHSVSIGLVTNQDGKRTINDSPTHQLYREGAISRADELGYNTEEFCLFANQIGERRLCSIMYSRGIDIVVLFPLLDRGPKRSIKLDWGKFAIATCGYSLRQPTLHRSCFAHMRGIMEACRKVAELGYKRPALVLDADQDRRSSHGWSGGFLAARKLANAKTSPLLHIPEVLTYSAFSSWFRRNRPDVLMHVGAEEQINDWISRCGAKIPDDIGYVHLDLWPSMIGNISGIDQQSFQVGAAAIDLAAGAIRVNERGIPPHPKIISTDGVWRPGATTRLQE
ncbi:MAG TPA: LacI family DNA-binding transcriptional regulator [Opitutaceae bacterium]|nr:LacI family DNA-binding transcriptional regulator [Opitutaceae bacterium]